MRQGLTIQGLADEVARRQNAKRDFLAPSRAVKIIGGDGAALSLAVADQEFGIKDLAHSQIAEHFGIPGNFYNRLRDELPALAAYNVNTLAQARPADEKRLVRVLDGSTRAFLSDRYRCIDNIDMVEQLLPVLFDRPDLRFASADITDRKLYIKVVSDELTGEVKRGDMVRMGLLLQNSEVGAGSWLIAPFTERLVCTNGATHLDLGNRRNHIGRKGEDDSDEARELFSDETRKAEDRAFFLKARDVIKATLAGDTLAKILDQMRAAEADKIEGDPAAVVEMVADHNGFNEAERTATLRNLIEGADLSRWGLANAITATAKDVPSYDRASDLEALGGSMMANPIPTVDRVSVKRRRSGRAVAASN